MTDQEFKDDMQVVSQIKEKIKNEDNAAFLCIGARMTDNDNGFELQATLGGSSLLLYNCIARLCETDDDWKDLIMFAATNILLSKKTQEKEQTEV